jgi:ubiquinone/menaquinone biosynthesis C-methylase UbiE
MNKEELEEKMKDHLLMTVGGKPSKEEADLIDAEVRKGYDKIYDGTDKDESLIAKVYTKELSKYWVKVVANEDLVQEFLSFQENVKINPKYKIASLASGLAVFELFLAKEIVPNGFVTCVDISEGMNEIAKKYADELNQKNIRIITSSVFEIPIESDSQDVVIARRTGLSKDKKWPNVLKEAYRILKKQETSCFVYTVDKIYNDPLNEIEPLLQGVNLKLVKMIESHSSNNGVVCMIIAKPQL